MRAPRIAEPLCAVAIVLLATLVLFLPLAADGPRWFEWDVPEQYWPDLVFACESLHDGALPYWNPYDRGGYPVHADPQAALYHPLTFLICGVAGPSPALGWATARVVIGFAMAGLFGILWLRRLGVSWPAAALGAVVLETAPFMRHNWELNLTLGMAHLPLVLWALERVMTERRARDGALLALSAGLLTWAGSPPAMYLAVSYAVAYGIFRGVQIARVEGRAALAGAARALTVALALGASLVAVVVVPAMELARHSVQAGRGYASIAEDALAPSDLLALIWPMSGNHLYVGLVALLLGAFALARARGGQRWFFAATILAGVLMTLGDRGVLFRVAYDVVPGVSVFRSPHRYEAWLGPSAAGLTALGLGALEPRLRSLLASSRAPQVGLWVVTAALVFAGLADVTRALPEDRHLRAGVGPPSIASADEILAHAPGTEARYRYFDEFAISCRSGTRLRHRDLRGYQDPLLLSEHERVLAALDDHPELLMQFNVRYVLSGPHFIHGWNRHYLPRPRALAALEGARVVFRDGERTVTELSRALPLGYFVPSDRIERRASRAEALTRTIALAPAPIAVLDGAADPEGAPLPASSGTDAGSGPDRLAATVRRYEPDAVELSIDAPTRGVLVVNEAFYPGWRADVDGREVPIFRANGFVRALPVDAGPHEIRLAYAPPLARALRWLALVALLVALALLIPRRDRGGSE